MGKIRSLTYANLMKFLKKKEEIFGCSLTLELRSGGEGAIVNSASSTIVDSWSNLSELNEHMNDTLTIYNNKKPGSNE